MMYEHYKWNWNKLNKCQSNIFSCLLEYNPFQSSLILLLRASPFGILCLFWVFYSFMPIMWYFQFVLHPVHQPLFCLKLAWPRALFSETLEPFWAVSVSKIRDVYTWNFVMKGTSVHIKNMSIKQLCKDLRFYYM